MPFQTLKLPKSDVTSRWTRSDANVDTSRRNEAKREPLEAIAIMGADHKQVAGWFDRFEKTRSDAIKRTLAEQICAALTAHATIEEEIFYPAFLAPTGETDIHHYAEAEHQRSKSLIAEIAESSPDDEDFNTKVTVLGELIRHHVNEEEHRDGMFARARVSDTDLESLGEQLQQRKDEMVDETPTRVS